MPTDRPSPLPSDPPEAAQVLAPCPFCNSTNINPERWTSISSTLSIPVTKGPGCNDCGASANSVELWNRRPVPVAADQVGEVERRETAARELLDRYDHAAARARMVESPESVREHNAARLALFKALAPQLGAGDREAQNPICSADGCHRRSPCGIGCRDNGNFK